LPSGSTYVIREDHRNPNLLFVGTEFGIFASIDRGRKWTQLKAGLPTISVWDAVIHTRDNDLVIGTHGRSIWVLDIGPLQELTPQVLSSSAHLFDVKPATVFQYRNARDWSNEAQQNYAVANPPFGAVINYYVGKPLGSDVSVTVTNAAGSFRRELAGRGYSGVSQVVWDLRTTAGAAAAAARNSERTPWQDYAAGLAEPGEYLVTLVAGGARMTKTVIVEPETPAQPGRPVKLTTTPQ
jgi:ligand-binding sensor domain-containing protein